MKKETDRLDPAKGGRARAEKLTPDQRRDIAIRAAEARWARKGKAAIPRAVYGSADRPLQIASVSIPCYVLDDGRRVIVQRGMLTALDMKQGTAGRGDGDRIAKFIRTKGIKPFIDNKLEVVINNPIRFRPKSGGGIHYGYEATILADLCESVLRARREGRLHYQQAHIAEQCEVLVRAFAKTGIIALVDEATGYQDQRAKDALARILEQFITEELRPWVKTFPVEFYQGIYRLRGWKWPPKSNKHNSNVGRYTNDLVYERLAPGVKDELLRLTPRNERGRLKHKLHQHLTPDVGHPKLREHFASVIMAMNVSKSWEDFMRAMNRFLPKQPQHPTLPFDGA